MQELNKLNEFLSSVDLVNSKEPFKKNFCFIVGLPRSGSTLLQQILISRYSVGYVSNIVGKFWGNPVVGSILHNSLCENEYFSNFYSEYGNTKGPFEPCEFGWFWKRALDIDLVSESIGPKVNWDYINETLQKMSSVFKQPLILDTPFVCSHISKILQNPLILESK